jgi:MinD-like ATPase involved in chromosome partitioning or flagellar assembly
VAKQDKDQLAGAEESVHDNPSTAKATVPAGETPAAETSADAPVPGGNSARTGQEPAAPQAPPGMGRRPAGFAAGYPQPEPPGYSADRPAAAGTSGRDPAASVWMPPDAPGQASPYAPSYGDYPYSGQGQDQPGYAGYGQPMGYGADQGYGDDRGYGQDQVYAGQEGYGPGYAQQDYGEGQGYQPPAAYDDQRYAQGYTPGQPYPEGPVYGRDPAYGPAPGYTPPTTTGDTGQPQPGQPQPSQPQAGQHRGSVAGRDEKPDTDRAQPAGGGAPATPGPYPPQESYQWQQAPYETSGPAPSRPAPQDPYAQPRSRPEADPSRPYSPPRAPQNVQQPASASGDSLAPLPMHSGDQQQAAETADDLTADALLHGRRHAPEGGWRRILYKGSGGLIHPRESADAVRRRDLIARVRTPVAGGHHRVAVMSLKGGVGKTTTCVSLGAMLASLRGDRIIALDANPDRGTLSDKVRLETAATVRDLLNERDQIHRYADVRAFTSQAPSRLEILASDRDPAVSIAFSVEDYYEAASVLEHYYSISLTDCGTGLLHSAMAGVLRMADQIVLVSSPSVDGARSASATLDWLDAHEYGDLVRNAVVVLSMIRPRSKSTVDLDRLENHFAGRCRSVARIPYDAHLEEGAEVDLELMSPATVNAYLLLAATVGDGFAWPRRAARQTALRQNWERQRGGSNTAGRYR